MLEKPLRSLAGFADKVRKVAVSISQKAAHLAHKADRVSQSFTNRAEAIEARRHARREARLEAMALQAFGNRPSVLFLREVRHGQMSFRFYEATSRAGEVRVYWTLNRATAQGQVRLATGSMDEYRSIREMGREVRQKLDRREERAHHQGAARGQEARREGGHEREARGQHESRTAGRQEVRGEVREKPQERWISLIHVEALNRDGSARARIVQSSQNMKDIQKARLSSPGLAVHAVTHSRAPRYGDVVTVYRTDSPEVASRMKALQQQAQSKGVKVRVNANGVDHAREAARTAKQLTNQKNLSRGM